VRTGETPPVVTIGAKIAKKRRIRHVDIPVVALPWLSLWLLTVPLSYDAILNPQAAEHRVNRIVNAGF
jgi:hypothetical protein